MDNRSKSATAEKDPVCGMIVDPATAKHKSEHSGKAYYFCCPPCREKFRADPARLPCAAFSSAGRPSLIAGIAPANGAPAQRLRRASAERLRKIGNLGR